MGKVNDSKVDYWLTEDGITLLSGWARDSFTKKELADRMGITPSTLNKWCEEYEEINNAVNTTRDLVDYQVENSLLKMALGYTYKEIKVTTGKKVLDGEVYEVLKETTTKHVPANVNAITLWLNNRKFDQWKRNRDKVVEVDPDDSQVTITIQRGNKQKLDVEDDIEVNNSVTVSLNELNDAQNNLDDENDDFDEEEWGEDEWDDEEWDEN